MLDSVLRILLREIQGGVIGDSDYRATSLYCLIYYKELNTNRVAWKSIKRFKKQYYL